MLPLATFKLKFPVVYCTHLKNGATAKLQIFARHPSFFFESTKQFLHMRSLLLRRRIYLRASCLRLQILRSILLVHIPEFLFHTELGSRKSLWAPLRRRVGFTSEKVALEQYFLRVFRVSPVSIITPIL